MDVNFLFRDCKFNSLCSPEENSGTSLKVRQSPRHAQTKPAQMKLQRSLIWLMCSCSRGDPPNTPSFESALKENVSWMERLVFLFFFFSFFFWKLPMERSQPIENNEVRNPTLMKEMRKRKHGSFATSVHCRKKRTDEEWKTECVCVCVWVRVVCARRMGSFSGGRLFRHIVWTSIDEKWVRGRKKDGIKRGH